jgi:hypothetical protein
MNDRGFERFFKLAWGAGCVFVGLYLLIVAGVLFGLGWLAWQLIQRL